MTVLTQIEFARLIGHDKSHVTRLKQAGRLVMTEDGRVDVDASLARIEATRGQRYDVEARHAADRGPVSPVAPVEPDPATADEAAQPATGPDGAPLDVDEIGRRTRVAQMLTAEAVARAKERQDLLDAGEIIPRALVRADLATAAGLILSAADTLPDRLAPLLVGLTDQATVRAILRDEVEAYQRAVADQLAAVAAGAPGAPA